MRSALSAAFICLLALTVHSQNLQPKDDDVDKTTTTSSTNDIKNLEKNLLRNILLDQKNIWTAPFHLHSGDAKWAVPLTAGFITLWATDRQTSGELVENGDNEQRLRISKDVSQLGAAYTTGGVALGLYLFGRIDKNTKARETGLLAGEALINSAIVAQVLKAASQRQRPPADNSSGEFWDGGSSFPSGHAVSAWSVATVIAQEYGKHRPAVQIAAYGIASAVSIARFTGRNHFLSDALIGSAIGYGVGRYVYHQHHDPSLDAYNTTKSKSVTQSRWFPRITPLYASRAHAYGAGLQWAF